MSEHNTIIDKLRQKLTKMPSGIKDAVINLPNATLTAFSPLASSTDNDLTTAASAAGMIAVGNSFHQAQESAIKHIQEKQLDQDYVPNQVESWLLGLEASPEIKLAWDALVVSAPALIVLSLVDQSSAVSVAALMRAGVEGIANNIPEIMHMILDIGAVFSSVAALTSLGASASVLLRE